MQFKDQQERKSHDLNYPITRGENGGAFRRRRINFHPEKLPQPVHAAATVAGTRALPTQPALFD